MTAALLLLLSAVADPTCIVFFQAQPQKGNAVQVSVEALVEAPQEDVLRTLWDFDHYKEFMPRVKRAHHRPGNRIYTEIKAPWPLKDVWFVAEIQKRPSRGGMLVTWTMKEGNIRRNDGSWWIGPRPGGHSRLRYEGVIEFHRAIPPELMTFIQRFELPKVIQAVRQRAVGERPLQCAETVTQEM